MRKRGTSCRPVSVRLSIRHIRVLYCIQRDKDIVTLLSRPGSCVITVFRGHPVLPNSKGNPSAGALNTRLVGKFVIFD